MTQQEYARFVELLRADPPAATPILLDMIHALLGIGGEAGELLDIIKKHWIYGKPLDHIHVIEELGDLYHYFIMLLNNLSVSLDEVREANVRKLRVRYPDGYSPDRATSRNIGAERSALEGVE